jgi:hypothetical protein
MLDQLTDWVDWATWRYALDHRVIPERWPQHGALLEELSALYTAYNLAASGDAPMLWIEHFAAARARVTEWTARAGCRPDEHRER